MSGSSIGSGCSSNYNQSVKQNNVDFVASVIIEDEDNAEPEIVRIMSSRSDKKKHWGTIIDKLKQHRKDLTLIERQTGYKDKYVKINTKQKEQQKFLAQRLNPRN